jgi:hypothetical protein
MRKGPGSVCDKLNISVVICLPFTDYDYPFGIFKLFLNNQQIIGKKIIDKPEIYINVC